MMSFTYNTLLQALQDWPVNSDTVYVGNLPLIIAAGEDRLIVDLNLDIFDAVDATIVVTISNRNVPKPTGLLGTRTLYLISSNVRAQLKKRSRDFCMSYAPNPTTTGTPKYYCDLDTTNWMVVPTPVAGGTAEAHFIKRPTGLAVGNQNTWLATNAGDLLFKACLLEAEEYLKADDRWANIRTSYESLLGPRRLELRDSIRSGQYSPMAPAAQTVG